MDINNFFFFWQDTFDTLLKYIHQSLEQNKTQTVTLLLQKIDALCQEFIGDSLDVISKYISLDESGVLKKIDQSFIKQSEGSLDIHAPLTQTYLQVLHQVVIQLDDANLEIVRNLELQRYLLLLHCTKDAQIADLATKTFGVLIKRSNTLDVSLFQLWWNVIVICTNSLDSDIESVNGYIQWLRCINGDVLKTSISDLQKLFDSELYWDLMIQGLLSKSYDIRKYTLHILAQSLQKIDHNISNHTMLWDTTKTKQLFWEWKRYATLVNIVSIDTSIHQAGDSAADLIKLIGKESLIPKPWLRCLLSTGLKSSTDSIRTFVGNVALSLTAEDMEIFLDGYEFLTQMLLPQLMLASHFTVQREGLDKDYECEYGNKLTGFIESVLKYHSNSTVNNMAQALMEYLYKERYSFDPARLYIVRGIESGLRGRNVLSSSNLETLVQLFYTFAESELRSRVFFFLFFRLFFNINSLVTPSEWFISVSAAVSIRKNLFNEQKASILEFINNRPLFIEYFKDIDHFDTFDTDSAILFSEIHTELTGLESPQILEKDVDFYLSFLSWPNSQLFNTVSYQKRFINVFSQLFHNGLQEPLSPGLIEKISQNWSTLETCSWFHFESQANVAEILFKATSSSASEENLFEITNNLVLFNICISFSQPPVSQLDVVSVLDLASKIIKTKVPDRNNMPVKHAALLETHRALNTLLHLTNVSLTAKEMEKFFNVLSSNFEFVNFPCRTQICSSLLKVISESVTADILADSLQSIWSALAVDRLIATERSLHISFLDLALHKTTLSKSVESDQLSASLESVLSQVIELSYARRCLLPHLTKKLLEYLVYTTTVEEKELPQFIGLILTRVYTFNQATDNLFRLEIVISRLFDLHPFSPIDKRGSSYIQEYGCQEIESRIYAASFFAALNTHSKSHAKFANDLYEYILHGEDTPYNIFVLRKRNDGLEEKERVHALQILLLLSRFYQNSQTQVLEEKFNELLPLLDPEPSPVARIYIEWLISRFNVSLITASGKDISSNKILMDMDKYEESPRVIASLERIALLTARSLRFQGHELAGHYYKEYVSKLVPFSSSNRATVRHSAVSMLVAVEGEFLTCESNLLKLDPQVMVVIQRICDNARASDSFKQHRSGDSSIWQPDTDYNLAGICGGVIRKLCDRHISVITLKQFSDCSFSSLTIPGTTRHLELSIPAGFTFSYDEWKPQEDAESELESQLDGSVNATAAEPAPLQTKSGFWNAVIDLSLGESGRDSDKVERSELIVVSSLVDKAPNLGGICRLCDVLGAKLLCLNDLSVSKNIQFKTVAVTADRWMPMAQVREGKELIEFMMEKKKEGYTLIGLEQTDKSVELNADLKFPKKSLILLGKEREGIPGEYLAELDTCVEIKQVGVIRSMNIQTATAIIVHAYSIQHC